MAIYELTGEAITPLSETTFSLEQLRERGDLQRLLRDHIGIVAAGTMVITEEFGSWEDSRRRIDLLALDRSGGLVVVELKRDTVGHMELQAIRYAAMVSAMTFEQATAAHGAYRQARALDGDAEEALLEFLGWDEADEDSFAQQVRIVLVAGDFSRELTTAVLWLNEHDLDIRCVRLKPYSWQGRLLLDVQQVIPLPEAADYQVQVREKARRERAQRRDGRDLTKYDVTVDGRTEQRLPKRRAIYLLVRHLCGRGVSPEEIHKVIPWRVTGLWRVVDGEVDAETFVREASTAASAGGPAFDPRRWFCDDDELLRHGGRTYALTKGWGHRFEQALHDLLTAFPSDDIEIVPSSDGE